MPADQLAFLKQFEGAPSNELFRDKQFRRLMKSFVPDCIFHYGRDMSLQDALSMVIGGSREAVEIYDGRYLMLSGSEGPYLDGRGFLWIDLQDGIGLGGFYFHPVNGEPTPSMNVFSRQVRVDALALSQLPQAFSMDLGRWSDAFRVPLVTPRYFLTGANRKILLEHDEDFCIVGDGLAVAPGSGCEQVNADAADVDLNAAFYLEQVNHATNATAWMIAGGEQTAWLQVRVNMCAAAPDPLGCRIRLTREQTHRMIRPRPMPHG